MSGEMSTELEHLLLDLAVVERGIVEASGRLDRRQQEIAKPLAERVAGVPAAERAAAKKGAAEELATLRRGKYRSELAHLAAEIVTAERRRSQILRKLAAYPQFGESVPAIDLVFEHDGERSFVVKAGAGQVFRFTLPVVIFRELWRGDGQYVRGDATTHDGSLWIAVADAPTCEPGKGPDWRLAAMRGKNGRDAKVR